MSVIRLTLISFRKSNAVCEAAVCCKQLFPLHQTFPVIKVLASITELISSAGSAVVCMNFVKEKTRGVKNDSKVTVPAKGLMRLSVLSRLPGHPVLPAPSLCSPSALQLAERNFTKYYC